MSAILSITGIALVRQATLTLVAAKLASVHPGWDRAAVVKHTITQMNTQTMNGSNSNSRTNNSNSRSNNSSK
jgi:hypothetical protein